MKTGESYWYSDQTKEVTGENGYLFKHHTVFKVSVFNGNLDEAERKARTVNDKLDFGKMPGGMFTEKGINQYFEKEYTVINVPDNTKIQPYNDHDKFIMALIEREENMNFVIL